MRSEAINTETAGANTPAVSLSDPFTRSDAPAWSVRLWPHRSLSREGFRALMLLCAAGFALPLLALAPTGLSLVLAPWALAALFMLWLLLKINYRSGRLTEELRLWPDAIAVERREPGGRVRRWSANPYWVDVDLTDTRDVRHYLTLRGGGRTIELGAFLTPDERAALAAELRSRIAGLNRPAF